MDDVQGIAAVTGRPTVNVSSETANPAGVLIGVGPADAVDDGLSAVAVEEITDLDVDPFRLTVTTRSGDSAGRAPRRTGVLGRLRELALPGRAELDDPGRGLPPRRDERRRQSRRNDPDPDAGRAPARVRRLARRIYIDGGLLTAAGIALLVAGVRRGSGTWGGGGVAGGPAVWPSPQPPVGTGARPWAPLRDTSRPAAMVVPNFFLSQSITVMVNRYEVRAADPDGSEGQLLALAEQKRMKLKENVNLDVCRAADRSDGVEPARAPEPCSVVLVASRCPRVGGRVPEYEGRRFHDSFPAATAGHHGGCDPVTMIADRGGTRPRPPSAPGHEAGPRPTEGRRR